MVRNFQRDYPHQVRLKHPHDWREEHVRHQLQHLASLHDYRWWTEGKLFSEEYTSVYGFKSQIEAEAFQLWADTCGIDWNVRSDQQERLPAPQSKAEGHDGSFAAHLDVSGRKRR